MNAEEGGVDVPVVVATERVKRVRNTVSHLGGVPWDDIELESDEEDYRPAKRGKIASKDAGQQQGIDTYTPPSAAHEYHLDLETAWAVGFNAVSLTEEEEDLLPSGSQENIYCEVRNHILTRWRENVSRYLTVEQAEAGVKPELRKYARVAWTFLNTAGYINFGVAPDLIARALKTAPTRGTVIVVGAGLAGLSAARQLRAFGFKVVILEGHARPGGRVYTKRLQAEGHAAVADLGGSIITGIDGNPLAVLAAQRGIPMHDINTAGVPLYLEDGSEADTRIDNKVEKEHNVLLDECDRFREDMGEITDNISLATALETIWVSRREESASGGGNREESNGKSKAESRAELERQLLDWHFANLEFANAAPLSALSLRTWDQDDPHEMQGAHTFLPGGNLRLVAALTEGLPVVYNSVVKEVLYSKKGVAVRTATQEFQGDAVLVTVPLGVLKESSIKFEPPLPQRKLDSIQRMGFGVLNKVVLLFPHAFWRKVDMFGRIAASSERRGEFFLFYSYATISGSAVLAALVAGQAAAEFERTEPEEAARRVLAALRGIFNPKGIHVPAPLQVVCTRWGADPLARGSYSSIAVGALGGEEYDILGQSVAARVFFAGEATTKKHPATMHGAFLSGLREAANLKATLEKERAEADAAAAAARAAASANGTATRWPPFQDDQCVRRARLTARVAQALKQVFNDPHRPPDMEFGCFTALYGPHGSAFEKQALLRVDVGAGRTGRGKAMPMIVPMSRSDVARLRDVKGGDEARFGLLMGPLGAKLVGRLLPADSFALMQAVLAARGIHITEERPQPAAATPAAARAPAALQLHRQQGGPAASQQRPDANGVHLPNGGSAQPLQSQAPQRPPSAGPQTSRPATSQPSVAYLLQQLAPVLLGRQQQPPHQQQPRPAGAAHNGNGGGVQATTQSSSGCPAPSQPQGPAPQSGLPRPADAAPTFQQPGASASAPFHATPNSDVPGVAAPPSANLQCLPAPAAAQGRSVPQHPAVQLSGIMSGDSEQHPALHSSAVPLQSPAAGVNGSATAERLQQQRQHVAAPHTAAQPAAASRAGNAADSLSIDPDLLAKVKASLAQQAPHLFQPSPLSGWSRTEGT